VDWKKFDRLVSDTVGRLKAAEGDPEAVEASILRYIEQGDKLGASPYDLWDFFAISSPGIPERAGYRGIEGKQMTTVFERLSEQRFGG
jgi:hypothetical protein